MGGVDDVGCFGVDDVEEGFELGHLDLAGLVADEVAVDVSPGEGVGEAEMVGG